MKQYMTTQLVEAEELEHGPYRVHFPALGFGAVVLADKFAAECHPIDRLEVGFQLVLEGLKHGLKFRRSTWSGMALVALNEDGMFRVRYECESRDKPGETYSQFDDCMDIMDLVAEDWVVVP